MKFLKNPRERFLFWLLTSVVGSFVLLAGGAKLLERETFVQSQLFQLRSENFELRSWIADKARIEAQEKWLEDNLPKNADVRRDGLQFLESLEKSAAEAGVKITAKSIMDPRTSPAFTSIPVRLSTQGEFRSLAAFLHAIQAPKEFVIVRELGIKAGASSNEVLSEMELLKVFRPLAAGKPQS